MSTLPSSELFRDNGSSVKVCAVLGCDSAETTPDVHLFPFPITTKRCWNWLLMCQRKDLISETVENLNKNYSVCSVHFSSGSFVKHHKKILKVNAVPSLHIQTPQITTVASIQMQTPPRHTTPPSFHDSAQPQHPIDTYQETVHLMETTLEQSFFMEHHTETFAIKNNVTDEEKTTLNICRLCTESNFEKDTFNIFTEPDISEYIHACLPISVSLTDTLPTNICAGCCKRLKKHYKFHQTVIESDNVLREMYGEFVEASLPVGQILTEEAEDVDTTSAPDDIVTGLQNDHIYTEVFNESENDLPSSKVNYSDVGESHEIILESDCVMFDVATPAPDEAESLDSSVDSSVEVINVNDYEGCEEGMFMCTCCGGLAADLASLLAHALLEHSAPGVFTCVLCTDNTFPTEDQLLAHMNLHQYSQIKIIDLEGRDDELASLPVLDTPVPPVPGAPLAPLAPHAAPPSPRFSLACPFCDKRFRSKHRMEFHKKFHLGEEPGHCSICDKRFSDENLLYRHVWYLHSVTRRTGEASAGGRCSTCGASFTRKQARLAHEEQRHGVVRRCHQCEHCMEAFASAAQATQHVMLEHENVSLEEQNYQQVTVSRLFQCEYCFRLYTKLQALVQHRYIHHTTRPKFSCRHCRLLFTCHRQLQQHVAGAGHGKDEPPRPVARKFFCCQYCNKLFSALGSLMGHIAHKRKDGISGDHGKESNFTDTNTEISLAVPAAESQGPYCCHHCFRTFRSESNRIKHIRMHTGERPFMCDTCGKCFTQSSGLYTHNKVHTDERPYSCALCERTFKIKCDRDIHQRKHSGARPFTCDTCGKTFMTQQVYSQHCKIHTDQRPYVCKICGDAFRRSHILKVHSLRHSGAKPHACSSCDKRYRQRGDLLKHLRVQHGVT